MYWRSLFFFYKQKTAYEMRISDWSSDVCSYDLRDASQSRGEAPAPDASTPSGAVGDCATGAGRCRLCPGICDARSDHARVRMLAESRNQPIEARPGGGRSCRVFAPRRVSAQMRIRRTVHRVRKYRKSGL